MNRFFRRHGEGLYDMADLASRSRRVPTIPICPPHLSRALFAWFESQGAAARLLLHERDHELLPEEITSARTFIAEGPFEAEQRLSQHLRYSVSLTQGAGSASGRTVIRGRATKWRVCLKSC